MLLVVWGEGQRVYVGSQTGRGGCVYAGDMVIYSNLVSHQRFLLAFIGSRANSHLLLHISNWLLDQVNEVWRAELSKR